MDRLLVTLGAVLGLVAALLLFSAARRARVRGRLFQEEAVEEESRSDPGRRRLAAWLVRAGHRGRRASRRFAIACAASAAAGLLATAVIRWSGAAQQVARALADLPVVGGALAALAGLVPFAVGLWIALGPILLVRSARRARVEAIEQDLPVALELLATLAEAGLGFDAAVARLLDSQPAERPLAEELRLFRLEMLSGVGRSECLQRIADRVDMPVVSSLVAALIQAEETGSGIADMLRPQAEDLRLRRRERALAHAEALPEKLVFPLLVGFLPGLLVWTLGPAFHQLFGMLDAVMRR
jgi:tight adherence protein C